MDKNQLIFNIKQALQSAEPTVHVNNVCRKYLKEEIKNAHMRDLTLEKHLNDIANHFEMALDVNLCRQEKNEGKENKNGSFWGGIGVACIASIALLSSDNVLIKSIGCAALLGSGYFVGKALNGSNNKENGAQLIIATSPEDIYIRLSHFKNSLSKLFDHTSLESCDKEMLRWLQKQYSESNDGNYKESIQDILEKCNYELCQYNNQIADFFDATPGNVELAKTTYLAVRNKSTDDYVLRGHVILPRKG